MTDRTYLVVKYIYYIYILSLNNHLKKKSQNICVLCNKCRPSSIKQVLDLPCGSQPCQSGSSCYKGCVRDEHEDRQGHTSSVPYQWWESSNLMHNELPLEPKLSAICLSQACNWYLSEEKGGPCQLKSCWEMKRARRARWGSEGKCLWGIKLIYVALCFVFMYVFLLSWLWTTMIQLYFIALIHAFKLIVSGVVFWLLLNLYVMILVMTAFLYIFLSPQANEFIAI